MIRSLLTSVTNTQSPIFFDVGDMRTLNLELRNLGPDPLVSLRGFGRIHRKATDWAIATDATGWDNVLVQGSNPYTLGADLSCLLKIDVTPYIEFWLVPISGGTSELLSFDFAISHVISTTATPPPPSGGGVNSVNGDTGPDVVLNAADVGAIALNTLPSLPDEIIVPFNYGSSSEFNLWTGTGLVREVVVRVNQPWNAPATLSVGDSANNQRLAQQDNILLTEANEYFNSSVHNYSSETVVRAFLDSGLSSAGSGEIILLF